MCGCPGLVKKNTVPKIENTPIQKPDPVAQLRQFQAFVQAVQKRSATGEGSHE